MKRTLLLLALLWGAGSLAAQERAAYRAEFVPFDTREDAAVQRREKIQEYVAFTPEAFLQRGDTLTYGQVVELPLLQTDRDIYLHLEAVGSAYTLLINDRRVADVEDPHSPREFLVTDFIRPGRNAVMVDLRPTRYPELQAATPADPRPRFANSYLVFQHRLHIDDYTLEIVPDSTRQFGVMNLDIVVRNSYNGAEPITAGYDIYDPKGKLKDYGFREITVEGHSTDTIRFERFIYGANSFEWNPASSPLYKVTLYVKRGGMLWEYIPLKTGFGRTEYRDGRFYRFGREIKTLYKRYNAAADEATTERELKALKAGGVGLLLPDFPQPHWFYSLCDRLGLLVVDRANLNAPDRRTDRRVGGTPSNDPALAAEYLERVKAMYYRSRNHSCVAAFSLGGDSGNGYNMYEAYRWLKSVETHRPVFYTDADGEWNSDPLPDALKPAQRAR